MPRVRSVSMNSFIGVARQRTMARGRPRPVTTYHKLSDISAAAAGQFVGVCG